MNSKNRMILQKWGVPIFIFVILLLIFKPFIYFFPKWFTYKYYDIFSQNNLEKISKISLKDTTSIAISPNTTGPIGDTYGGTLGPVIAMVAAFLTFMAFWIQYQANKIQEHYIRQQRFEDTFFRLLDHYKKNLDSMDIRDSKDASKIKAIGFDCFKVMYRELKQDLKGKTDKESINLFYDKLQDRFKQDLHHYFRFLYHILKFIKQSDIAEVEKLKYSSITRATLSAHELIFIFYNCLHDNGKTNFKPLVEYFSLLKNIDDSLIINEDQRREYHDLAFASSFERAKLLDDWKRKNSSF